MARHLLSPSYVQGLPMMVASAFTWIFYGWPAVCF
jgi:hypothetical protein